MRTHILQLRVQLLQLLLRLLLLLLLLLQLLLLLLNTRTACMTCAHTYSLYHTFTKTNTYRLYDIHKPYVYVKTFDTSNLFCLHICIHIRYTSNKYDSTYRLYDIHKLYVYINTFDTSNIYIYEHIRYSSNAFNTARTSTLNPKP